MKKIQVLILVGVMACGSHGLSVTCNPDSMDDDRDAIRDGDDFTITCNFDKEVDYCSWKHFSPLEESLDSSQLEQDCSFINGGNNGESSNFCDSRISGSVSGTSCSIQVTSSIPEDTGNWKLSAFHSDTVRIRLIRLIHELIQFSKTLSQGNDRAESASAEIRILTFNRSYVELQDEDRNRLGTYIETSYNWNDRENDWEEDYRSFETLEFYCFAAGARPRPTITWYLDKSRRNQLQDDDVFSISEVSNINSYGYDGVIKDYESSLEFQVSTKLLERLEQSGIDTNPERGDFNFDISCEVDQDSIGGGGSSMPIETVSVSVEKSYDNGYLKGSMIGLIVAIIIAVIILMVAIGLLIFAKSRNQWCFADDEYNYRNPKDPRSRPPGNTGGMRPSGHPSQQVYRFI